MRLGKLATLVAVLTVALVSGWSSSGEAVTLPACDNFICAFDGDFAVMSLPFAGVSVKSGPGQIDSGIVLYTGSSGKPVTTNFSGMDNAFAAPSGSGATDFSTLTSPDPSQITSFTGDVAGTWDSTITAFTTFLNGSTPLFFFNQNDTNNNGTTGSCPQALDAQDVCIYGMITLVDLDDPSKNLVFELEAPNRLFTDGPGTTDGIADLPAELVLAKGDVCLGATGAQVNCDGSEGAVVVGPVNHNLGTDHAAYVGFSDALNAALALCAQFGANTAQCPWDSLSIRLDLTDINNGFEQLFILTGAQLAVLPVPEPGTLILLGAGLVGLGASAWRRRQRG
jgi:hypothetical protein